jgi:hypothetical protein
LTIAWQYEKYLAAPLLGVNGGSTLNSSGMNWQFIFYFLFLSMNNSKICNTGSLKVSSVKSFCHSYDLSRAAKPEYIKSKFIQTLNITKQISSINFYQNLYKKISMSIEDGFKRFSLKTFLFHTDTSSVILLTKNCKEI